MHIIKRSDLVIPPRQRKEILRSAVEELKQSILRNSLLHAPVVQPKDEGFILVAGERRTRAIDLLATENTPFIYNNTTVAPGFLPVVFLNEAISVVQLQ